MAEVAGLLLGITGPLQQAIDLGQQIRLRMDAVGSHEAQVATLLQQFSRISSDLSALDRTSLQNLSDDQLRLVKSNVTDLKDQIVLSALPELRCVQSHMSGPVFRFMNALRNDAFMESLRTVRTASTSFIIQLTCLIAVVDVPSQIAATVRAAQERAVTREDFRACFAVERNDRFVAMDFATRRHGAFSSFEGRLKALILGSVSTVGTVATGVGGVGKTCALRAIAHEEDVRRRFPGGIYCRRLGQDSDVMRVRNTLCDFVELSGGAQRAAEMRTRSLEGAVALACAWFGPHRCLFIFDDVWQSNDIPHDILRKLSPLAGGYGPTDGESRIVYSTRDRELAAAACSAVVEFKRRTAHGPESRNMFLEAAQLAADGGLTDDCQRHFDEILRLCDGLPFTLNIAGRLLHKMLERNRRNPELVAWEQCARRLTTSSTNLLNDRRESYFASLSLSLAYLDENRAQSGSFSYQDAVEALCVMKKQDVFPSWLLKHLWGPLSEEDVESIVEDLESFGVVEVQNYQSGSASAEGICIHDHVHAHATWLAERSGRWSAWAKRVLQGLKQSMPIPGELEACWPVVVKADTYLEKNICRLLLDSNQLDLLKRTLGSVLWWARMMAADMGQYDKDIEAYMSRAGGDAQINTDEVAAQMIEQRFTPETMAFLETHFNH